MKKKWTTPAMAAVLAALMVSRTICAAELVEKEPVHIIEEDLPAVDSSIESEETNAETDNAAGMMKTEDSSEITAWKKALQEAVPSLSQMPVTLKNPNTGETFSSYCVTDSLGFYYDANRFELFETIQDAGTEILLRSKDSANTRSEMIIQLTNAKSQSTIEEIADYYISMLSDDAKEFTEENASAEGTEQSYVLEEVPSIGVSEIGPNCCPAFTVLSNSMSSYEEYYIIPTKEGYITLSLYAPITEYKKLEELSVILQSMIIENVEWDSTAAMQFANNTSTESVE